MKPPSDAKDIRPSVLAIHQGAGISKKSKNGRKSVISAKAARRKEKGMDRAEAFMDRKEKKVEKSKGRARNVQDRSKAWEVQNKTLLELRAAQELEEAEAGDNMEEVVSQDNEQEDKAMSGDAIATEDMVDAAQVTLPDPDEEEL